jgi:hypothetical protein
VGSHQFPQIVLLTLIYREEAERVSELKNISASNNLPYGTLVLGSEGIKDAIQNFDDAYVAYQSTVTLTDALPQAEIRYRERASTTRSHRPRGCKGIPLRPTNRWRSIATNNGIARAICLVRVVLTKRHAVVSNVAHHFRRTLPTRAWSSVKSGYYVNQSKYSQEEHRKHQESAERRR